MLYLLIINIFSFFMILIVSFHSANAVFYNNSSNAIRHGSCRLRSVRQAADPPPGRSMTESFVLDDIEYKLCRYHVTWDEALVFCSTHKAHLATLDNEEKTAFVVKAMASSSSVFEDYWIGARKYYDDLWTWDSSAQRLNSETEIIGNVPVLYPGDDTNDVHCLTIDRNGHDSPIFVPRACNQRRGFICQRDNARTYDNKLRMVAATRISDQEFRLYSGRTTWAEAVVQCREEGLQIGEVNTVEEARALSISMLRNRPEGIESAWIGGYTRAHDPGIWRWLASGEKIENNAMWRKNSSESSGGCLLLDRHLCETPVYVEATCDRKRDVLCQKPPKKRLSRKPIEAIVDGCPYWIGFYPLKWSEAKRSCESLNASLVVLDSPKTIAHMMSLMLDDRAGLRHIWTDGRRTRKSGKWQWEVNGEVIADFDGTFIPWCPDDNIYFNETDCLNLDREGLHSPLVYGLSCNEKQSYICQPRIGDCVSHSVPTIWNKGKMMTTGTKKLTSFVSLPPSYENSETLQYSKVTGTYPIVTDNYATISTSLDNKANLKYDEVDEFNSWKPGESISTRNWTSRNHLAQYLTPLSRLTLPSFPQFGIKVVSAHETTANSLLIYEIRKNKKIKQFSGTSSYALKSTILPSVYSSSTMANTLKNPLIDSRKTFRVSPKSSNFSSVTSYLGGFGESTTVPNLNRRQFLTSNLKSSTKVVSLDSKNVNFTKIGKISITPEDSFSSLNLQSGRTKKYSVKTTRDLNSNVTKMISIVTTKSSDLNISSYDEKVTTMLIPSLSTSGIYELNSFNGESKSNIDKFSPNSLKLITTPLPRKGQKLHFTTERTTPYDAIDEDYYENDETSNSKKKEKLKDEENYDESITEMDEYNDNYDEENDAKLSNKKKIKQSSKSNFEKSYTTVRSVAKISKAKEIGKNGKSGVPIARELSKNLQTALISMLKTGMEKKRLESVDNFVKPKKIVEETKNISPEMNVGKNNNMTVKSSKPKIITENWSLRPYYAFEGPMIVGFSEDPKFPQNAERIEENGKIRLVEFIGKKTMKFSTNVPNDNKSNIRLNENEARRSNIRGSLENKNVVNNIPLLISGLPAIRPDDPNSLMQMGRYFKNKFGNIVANGGQITEKIGRDEFEEYLKNERKEQPRWSPRLRGQNTGFRGQTSGKNRQRYSANKDDEFHENPQRYEGMNNYYESPRRLYPRGNYEIVKPRVLHEKTPRNIDRSWRQEQERLSVSWPRRNFTNSKISNIDVSQVVSPRNLPLPVRTTRSFNDDSEISKKENSKIVPLPLPDFKISKLVKEVKIDLDQKLLRNYLEGFTKKIFQKENSPYEKNDWKDTWRYLLEQMSRVLDRININVNGDVMKVRVGSDDTNKLKRIANLRNIEWKSGLRKQRKDFGHFRKMKNINDTSMEKSSSSNSLKLMENYRVSPNNLSKESSQKIINTKDNQTTDSYKIDAAKNSTSTNTEKIPYERENEIKSSENNVTTKYPQTGSETNNDKKTLNKTRNFLFHNDERASAPAINRNMNFHQLENNKKLRNWYQPKYMNNNNNNSRIIVAPAIIRSAGIYAFPPITPQLHHRIIFQQGLNQFRPNSRMDKVPGKSSILNGEYLPKGTLSKIIGREDKNHHFSQKSNSQNTFFRQRTGNSSKSNPNYLTDRHMSNERFENRKIDSTTFETLESFDNREKINNKNDEWQNHYDERNTFENEEFNYYANETNVDRFDDEFDKIVNEGINSRENYASKPILSSAHRLGKALELSHFNKFRKISMNYSPLKNLVTRSVRNNEISEKFDILRRKGRGSDNDRGRDAIVKNLENLKDEPSIVSLRIIMNSGKNVARISRQSIDSSKITQDHPQTVELRMRFSGNQKKSNWENGRIYSHFWKEGRKSFGNFSTIGNQTFKGMNKSDEKFDTTKKSPVRFLSKIRRQAMINKLRERLKLRIEKYPYLHTAKSENGTRILNSQNRKSRTIVTEKNGKNSIEEKKPSKYSDVRRYLAPSSRSFDNKNLRKRSNSTEIESGIDWIGQAASLFTDLRDSNDQLTLYVDLTLGRVGTKSQRNGKSKT